MIALAFDSSVALTSSCRRRKVSFMSPANAAGRSDGGSVAPATSSPGSRGV